MEKERMKKMTSTMEKRVSTIHHGSSAPRNPLWTKSTNSSDLRQKIYFQFSLIVTYIYWYWTMVPRPIAPNSLFLLFKWLKSHFFGKKWTSIKKKFIYTHFCKNNFRSTFLMSQRFQIWAFSQIAGRDENACCATFETYCVSPTVSNEIKTVSEVSEGTCA